jgi:fibronectin-binding autotransporter adhesin
VTGGGGGGGGGCVRLTFLQGTTVELRGTIRAVGGAGSSLVGEKDAIATGPGGGGSAGRIEVRAPGGRFLQDYRAVPLFDVRGGQGGNANSGSPNTGALQAGGGGGGGGGYVILDTSEAPGGRIDSFMTVYLDGGAGGRAFRGVDGEAGETGTLEIDP